MIINHRLNILHRPNRHAPSKSLEENQDATYQKEQELWKIKAKKLADAEERLRRANYGTAEDVIRSRQDQNAAETAGQAAKLQVAKRQAAADAVWAEKSLPTELEAERPWTVSTLSLHEKAAGIARRRHAWRAAQENKLSLAGSLVTAKGNSDSDKQSYQETLAKEDSFWNRGAASERWIAPEYRLKPPHECAWRDATKAPPFGTPDIPTPRREPPSTNSSDRSLQGASNRATCTGGAYEKQYPWSWAAEPKP